MKVILLKEKIILAGIRHLKQVWICSSCIIIPQQSEGASVQKHCSSEALSSHHQPNHSSPFRALLSHLGKQPREGVWWGRVYKNQLKSFAKCKPLYISGSPDTSHSQEGWNPPGVHTDWHFCSNSTPVAVLGLLLRATPCCLQASVSSTALWCCSAL